MREEFISNQIAVYKNSKTLIEFQDKLKVASILSYAHIHADGEPDGDGRKKHSLIGILMKDYSKGTGDKAVTVTANISPEEAKFILSRLSIGLQEFTYQQDKIFAPGMKQGTPESPKCGSSAPLRIPREMCVSSPGMWRWRTEKGSRRKMQTAEPICRQTLLSARERSLQI